jgi:Flp pilus assembly protein TadG
MEKRFLSRDLGIVRRAARDTRGTVAIQFAIVLVALVGITGVAVDYSRAGRVTADLQAGLDAAVLAAVRNGSDTWEQVAHDAFDANISPLDVLNPAPAFTRDADGTVHGTVAAAVPTKLVRILGISSIDVGTTAEATAVRNEDRSCILTLGSGDDREDTLRFNGAPNLDFDQCTIRSNASIRCNGHDGGSIASIAVGVVSGCSNPDEGAAAVPDIYAGLSADMTLMCGASRPGAAWAPGSPPAGVISVDRGRYTEYHICGDLTLSGNGYLTGSAPAADTVIVVENGGLIVAAEASISTRRVAIVLTGNNDHPSSVVFPNGKGHAASLSLSPATDPDNPWHGVSLYQDPALTNGVDNDWGPAVTFTPDGLVYLPNSDVVMRGNSNSNISGCTKFIARSLTTNGGANINYSQSIESCRSLAVEQWYESNPYLTQ